MKHRTIKMAAKRSTEDGSPCATEDREDSKRVKPDTTDTTASVHTVLQNLHGFFNKEVLNVNNNTKTVFLRCGLKERKGDAIVILEKTTFKEEQFDRILTDETSLQQQLHNDIYGTYVGLLSAELNDVKATIIHPATDKHIQKYRSSVTFMVQETPQDYCTVTKPYIEQRTQTSLTWVENILEHKSEADRIVFEDPDPENGFILLPDMKWDRSKVEELYLVAIIHKRGITSLRELDDSHLPLLKNIQNKALTAIKEKFGIARHHLRIFFHYQPSYYHLHVHFTHMKGDGSSAFAAVSTEKAHLLDTVITNIQLMSNYYKTVNLTYALKEDDALWKEFEKVGKFKIESL